MLLVSEYCSLNAGGAVGCSYNADMLPDLLVENASGSWTIYLASVKRGFVAMEPLARRPLAVPHSSAFVNLREDYAAGTRCSLSHLHF